MFQLFRKPKYQTIPNLLELLDRIKETYAPNGKGQDSLDAEKKKILGFGFVTQLAYALQDENIQITDKRETIAVSINDWRYFGDSQYAETCRLCRKIIPIHSDLYRLDHLLHKDKSKVVICTNCFPQNEWSNHND